MLQRLFNSITLISILFVLGSCSQNKKETKNLSPINPRIEQLDNVADSAMLVRLDSKDDKQITVTTLEGRRKKTYKISNAAGNGQIKGTLTIGDTLSIFPETKTGQLLISINVSELGGRWFYDMAQHRGMTFSPLGKMSSINPENVSFREWKLLNGKLYIYYVDMQQAADERHQFLVEEAEIISLDRNRLELTFLNTDFACQRQMEVIKWGSENSN